MGFPLEKWQKEENTYFFRSPPFPAKKKEEKKKLACEINNLGKGVMFLFDFSVFIFFIKITPGIFFLMVLYHCEIGSNGWRSALTEYFSS